MGCMYFIPSSDKNFHLITLLLFRLKGDVSEEVMQFGALVCL